MVCRRARATLSSLQLPKAVRRVIVRSPKCQVALWHHHTQTVAPPPTPVSMGTFALSCVLLELPSRVCSYARMGLGLAPLVVRHHRAYPHLPALRHRHRSRHHRLRFHHCRPHRRRPHHTWSATSLQNSIRRCFLVFSRHAAYHRDTSGPSHGHTRHGDQCLHNAPGCRGSHPATGKWPCDKTVASGELFYAFNDTSNAADTGYGVDRSLIIYFVQDFVGDVYLVMTAGMAGSLGGSLVMNVTSTGLAGSAIQLIRSDAAGDAIWDSTDGTGRFAWDWNHGSAWGCSWSHSQHGFSMTFKASSWKNVAAVRLASFDPTTNDISFVSIDTADALGDEKLLKLNGHSCTNFCQLQSSCGECTASQFCRWCGATSRCLSNADISDGNAVCPSDYTQPLNSCNVCLQQMTASPVCRHQAVDSYLIKLRQRIRRAFAYRVHQLQLQVYLVASLMGRVRSVKRCVLQSTAVNGMVNGWPDEMAPCEKKKDFIVFTSPLYRTPVAVSRSAKRHSIICARIDSHYDHP